MMHHFINFIQLQIQHITITQKTSNLINLNHQFLYQFSDTSSTQINFVNIFFIKYLLQMVAGNIQERINKMKEAILTEAKQRAHLIVENANQEADQERAKIYNAQKEKIQLEFAQLAKTQKVKEKIDKSALHNRHRIQRMQARYQFVQKLRSEVNQRLRKIIGDQSVYKTLTKQLITQGMLRLMERNINVQLKEEHIPLAKSLFGDCEKSFSEILLNQTGKEMESKLSVSQYNLQEKNQKIIGGVFLRSSDGVIVCDNSLDSRVRLLFEQLLPTIRNTLFPKREAQKQKSLI